MLISSNINRYIPQGRSACKPFCKKKAGFLPFALVLPTLFLIMTIVALSPHPASAGIGKCSKPGDAFSRFAPAVPPRPVTDLPFYDANDKPRTLADYRGRGLLVNFWATWCLPCVKELPALSQLRRNLASDDIEVIALSLDRGGAPVVKRFFKKIGIDNIEILIDKGSKVSRKTRTAGLPTTVFIDKDGIERGRVIGYAEWDSDDAADFIRRCIGPNN